MPGLYPDGFDEGLYLPTTEIFDVGDLEQAGVNNQRFRELLIRLAQKVNTINTVINYKSSSFYPEEEFVDGNVWPPDPTLSSSSAQTPELRQEFRKVFNIGQLSAVGPTTVNHGLTVNTNLTFTRIYGTASDTAGNVYIPLPFVDVSATVAAGSIELKVTNTQIVITPTNAAFAGAFDNCYVVLEYLKN